MEIDQALRWHIYTVTLRDGIPPSIEDLAATLHVDVEAVRRGVERLASGRIVALQPASGELLMVPPFSAVPTPFLVETSRYACYANCAWDALGVPIMLGEPARVVSACACCGEAIVVEVMPDRAPTIDNVVHFAVPAARWWQDIVFT